MVGYQAANIVTILHLQYLLLQKYMKNIELLHHYCYNIGSILLQYCKNILTFEIAKKHFIVTILYTNIVTIYHQYWYNIASLLYYCNNIEFAIFHYCKNGENIATYCNSNIFAIVHTFFRIFSK